MSSSSNIRRGGAKHARPRLDPATGIADASEGLAATSARLPGKAEAFSPPSFLDQQDDPISRGGHHALPVMARQNIYQQSFENSDSAESGLLARDLMHVPGPPFPRATTFPSLDRYHDSGARQSDAYRPNEDSGAGLERPAFPERRGFAAFNEPGGTLHPPLDYTEPPLAFGPPRARSTFDPEYPAFLDQLDESESVGDASKHHRKGSDKPHYSQRRANKDEFDGPVQFLPKPSPEKTALQDQELPHMPVSLDISEQDEVLRKVNGQLSQCAFDFIARYQFPVPLEPDKRPVQKPGDREWTEWAYLIKRLATKRRIPARVLYNGQIKQLVTVLENSLEMRHASAHQSRPPKDDRNVLQLISAGIQVTKMLKDALAMEYLDQLYREVERLIRDRHQASFGYGM